jgi:hypothetical protein
VVTTKTDTFCCTQYYLMECCYNTTGKFTINRKQLFVAVNHAVYVQTEHSFCNNKAVMDLSCIFPDPAESLDVISSQVKESLYLYNDKMVSLFFLSVICIRYLIVCCLPIWDDFCNSQGPVNSIAPIPSSIATSRLL